MISLGQHKINIFRMKSIATQRILIEYFEFMESFDDVSIRGCGSGVFGAPMFALSASLQSLLTLLLGPPGCGKTTLLLALAEKLNQSVKMSLVIDSPVHSSNSEDFATFLDAELNSTFDISPDLDGEDEDEDEDDDDDEDDSKPNIERIFSHNMSRLLIVDARFSLIFFDQVSKFL